VDGIPFVTSQRYRFALAEITIDEQELWGRTGLVVYQTGLAASGGC
jgi:hypothetical protein